VYIEDLVRPQVLREIEERLSYFKIDSVLESGTLEQMIETQWYSPFPQSQVTQRPDKVASAILEGRVAIVVDNTPFVLLLPTTMNCFFQSSEDYYQRWYVMSFVRILRYCAAFLSFAIPGFYIALTTFHPSMIPTPLIFSIAAAREGVPFPALVEVLIMEIAFELLREAGVRLPAPIGNTIGIVGGLIVGQAVVQANLVSPIIVIIVALTAISSFAIPSYSLTSAFRMIKYLIIILSSFLGFLGFWLGILIVLTHLVSLKSMDIPYLSPYVAREVNNQDLKDSLIRMPTFMNRLRPVFTTTNNKVRLDIKEKGENNVFTKQ
jgi:spore germination protein